RHERAMAVKTNLRVRSNPLWRLSWFDFTISFRYNLRGCGGPYSICRHRSNPAFPQRCDSTHTVYFLFLCIQECQQQTVRTKERPTRLWLRTSESPSQNLPYRV